MSMFTISPGTRYRGVTFDAGELHVIRNACLTIAACEEARLDEAADQGLEKFALRARKVNELALAAQLVSLFKPGQEVLIEPEDLAPIAESLKTYGHGAPEDQLETLGRALEKIKRCCG